MATARIDNVAGAVVAGGAGGAVVAVTQTSARPAMECLDALFTDTLVAEGDPAVDGPVFGALVAALQSANAERVFVVEPVGSPPAVDVMLALTCWPEADAIVFAGSDEGARCALYRRAPALDRAREVDDVDALLASLEAERIDAAALGVADAAGAGAR